MILNNAPSNAAILSNVGQTQNFAIKASAKSFAILSSGLYSDKIKAVVRELSCNALDSHKAAGNDEPFEVHLPSFLEPYFSVKDYGVGLSHDQVMSLYTTYFESTKTDSNEFVGALGLGSKSPFSYTQNFTVIAIKDGRRGVYTAFINDNGVPSIALMEESATVEHSGVEVKFAVEANDMRAFSDAAVVGVFPYFEENSYKIVNSNAAIATKKYKKKDIIPGVHLLETDRYSRNQGSSFAIMGNICYPVDKNILLKYWENSVKKTESSNSDAISSLTGAFITSLSLEMHFEIGELDFVPSREGLSYDNRTINALISKITEAGKEFVSGAVKQLSAITNIWEKCEAYGSQKDLLPSNIYKALLNLVPLNTGNNDNFKISIGLDSQQIAFAPDDRQKFAYLKNKWNIKLSKIIEASHSHTECDSIPDIGNKHFRFVVQEGKANPRARYKWNIENCSGSNKKLADLSAQPYQMFKTYLVAPIDKKLPMNTVEFFKFVGDPPEKIVVFDAELEKRPSKRVAPTEYGLYLYERRGGLGRNADNLVLRKYIKETTEQALANSAKKYFYIPLDQMVGQILPGLKPGCGLDANLAIQMFHHTFRKENGDELDIDIFGVSKKDLPKILKAKNFVPFYDYFRELVKMAHQGVIAARTKEKFDELYKMPYNLNMDLIGKNSPFREVHLKFSAIKKVVIIDKKKVSPSRIETLTKEHAGFDSSIDLVKDTEKDIKKYGEIMDKYPMIRYVRDASPGLVEQYINLVDNGNNSKKESE